MTLKTELELKKETLASRIIVEKVRFDTDVAEKENGGGREKQRERMNDSCALDFSDESKSSIRKKQAI